MKNHVLSLFSALTFAALVGACATSQPARTTNNPAPAKTKETSSAAPPAGRGAFSGGMAIISGKSGSTLKGKAIFKPSPDGVSIFIHLTGAKPGEHAVHIHQNGDCSSADGESAGGHFNPEGHAHGLPAQTARHLGDLGNIKVGANGEAEVEVIRKGAQIHAGKKLSFLNRAIVVHAKADTGAQPAGGAGARVGCGVIKLYEVVD